MAIVTTWKKGTFSNLAKLNAQTIYDEFRSIAVAHNHPYEMLPNQDIVDFARANPNSESYKIFEWNDTIAAESYRRRQANTAKNSLVTFELENPQVSIKNNENVKLEIPAFINPSSDQVKNHAPTEIVMSKPDLRKAALEKALSELNSFQKRYAFLTELANVFDAITKANQINIP